VKKLSDSQINSNSFAEVSEFILSVKRIVIVSHCDPDPDAYGSSCALLLALQQCGKEVICLNQSELGRNYHFIPAVESIQQSCPGRNWDAVITCDCAEFERVGEELFRNLSGLGKVVNIDHHISNTCYGDFNLVFGNASSTAEVIFELLEEMRIKISSPIATCLLTGIMADSGCFRYNTVSSRTFEIAAKLINCGAEHQIVSNGVYGERSIASVRLQAEALSKVRLHCDAQVAQLVVSQEMFNRYDATAEDCENLVEHARDIEGVLISSFIRAYGKKWKVSLRSKGPEYDVSRIASDFGGGGHQQAAAFRWGGSLEELEKRLLARIRQEFS
jgi:bifunctional oligoribonuclease and PAP phosphatase NrnA